MTIDPRPDNAMDADLLDGRLKAEPPAFRLMFYFGRPMGGYALHFRAEEVNAIGNVRCAAIGREYAAFRRAYSEQWELEGPQ